MKHKQRGSAMMIILPIIVLLALALAFWWVWRQNKSDEDKTANITMGIFSPGLTTMVADAQGFLEEENITVEYAQVTGSEQQFESLRDGEYDLILTAPDNVLQYRLNESNALGGTFDVQAVAGTNNGQGLSLVVRPDVDSYEDLRGDDLAVDSPVSGFAFVLYQMMRNHGLEQGQDYQVVEAGGSGGRLQALLNNEFSGTLLLSGLELRAEDQGMNILEGTTETIPGYLGGVIAGRESWLNDNRNKVERLLRAYQKANDWIFDSTNREAAIALLAEQSEVNESLAAKMYDVQITPGVGLIKDQGITQEEFRTVLKLRQDWNGFDEMQDLDYLASTEGGLYDLSYLEASRE